MGYNVQPIWKASPTSGLMSQIPMMRESSISYAWSDDQNRHCRQQRRICWCRTAPVEEFNPKEWRRLVELNLTGVLEVLCHHVVRAHASHRLGTDRQCGLLGGKRRHTDAVRVLGCKSRGHCIDEEFSEGVWRTQIFQ